MIAPSTFCRVGKWPNFACTRSGSTLTFQTRQQIAVNRKYAWSGAHAKAARDEDDE